MSETVIQQREPVPVSPDRKNLLAWGKLITLNVFAIYIFIFMEWLFYVTKPSFMDFIPFGTKLGIMLLPGLLIVVGSLPFLLLMFAGSLCWLVNPRLTGPFLALLQISGPMKTI